MESEWNTMILNRSYQELLESTNEALKLSPDNMPAATYKARALVYLRRYPKAFMALVKALSLPLPPHHRVKIKKLMKSCEELIRFHENYETNCENAAVFPENWYQDESKKIVNGKQESLTFEEFQKFTEDCVFVITFPENFYSGEGYSCVSRRLLSGFHEFPSAQINRGLLYHDDQIYPFFQSLKKQEFNYSSVTPLCRFPTRDWQSQYPVIKPHNESDIFFTYNAIDEETHKMLVWALDRIANSTQDYFVPMYQNIIDPNLTVMKQEKADSLDLKRKRKKDSPFRWTASEFLIDEIQILNKEIVYALQLCVLKSIKKKFAKYTVMEIFSFLEAKDNGILGSVGKARLCSPISNLPMENHIELYSAVEKIFNAALPLLAKLRKPALLLPGKVQTVIKAQRIYLNPGEEYSGVWHTDGKNEEIIGVILYYYRVSDELIGGDIEFMNKMPKDDIFWLHGDCSPDSFDPADAKKFFDELPHSKVPIKTGTLLVFSNYESVHRVLRMVYPESADGDKAAPGGFASRDFLVFFVVDQRSPLVSTRDFVRKDSEDAVIDIRNELFLDQLIPSGKVGVSNDIVSSTGNGSVALLSWMNKNMRDADTNNGGKNRSALQNLALLNLTPPLGRGISWILDPDSFLLANDEYEISAWK